MYCTGSTFFCMYDTYVHTDVCNLYSTWYSYASPGDYVSYRAFLHVDVITVFRFSHVLNSRCSMTHDTPARNTYVKLVKT